MKKLLGIVVLGLLLSGNAYAAESMKITCKGTQTTSGDGNYNETKTFIENSLAIFNNEGKLIGVQIIDTTGWWLRPSMYTIGAGDSGNLTINSDTIQMTAKNRKLKKTTLKNSNATMSLTSGNYKGSLSYTDKKIYKTWKFRFSWAAKCEGVNQIYAYLNKKKEEEKKRIAEEKRKKEEEKRIAEKPKKKEPKQIPEDEKFQKIMK